MIGFSTAAIVFKYGEVFSLLQVIYIVTHDIIPAIKKIVDTMTDLIKYSHQVLINMFFQVNKMGTPVMVGCIT